MTTFLWFSLAEISPNVLIQSQLNVKPVERTNSSSSVSSYGLGFLSRTHSKQEYSNYPHIAISPQLSGQIVDPSHVPLSRIVYKQKQIGLLPRASLERRNSSEDERIAMSSVNNNRRDSNNSDKSRSNTSGFNSSGYDIKHHKRSGPDGHEKEDRFV